MEDLEKATFAGGCFWCMEPPFKKLKGVKSVISGYTGGKMPNPTYQEVCSGKTGHAEAVEVIFDPKEISYKELLDVFWCNIDPTMLNQQFADFGSQYRTAVFYHDKEQERLAKGSKEELEKAKIFDKPVVTEITPAGVFYPAEEYHQNYCHKNPVHYKLYRTGSGREGFLEKVWGTRGK